MKITQILKMSLGIIIISCSHVITTQLISENFIFNILFGTLFWLSITIFMDWRVWVKR